MKYVKQYLSEQVNFGGEIMTRGQVIQELQKITNNKQMIDRYLQGLDYKRK